MSSPTTSCLRKLVKLPRSMSDFIKIKRHFMEISKRKFMEIKTEVVEIKREFMKNWDLFRA